MTDIVELSSVTYNESDYNKLNEKQKQVIQDYLYDKILQIYTSDKNNTKSNIEYINLYKYVNMFICITKL